MEVVDLSREKHLDNLLRDLPPLSLDLLQSASHELDFLKAVDDLECLYDRVALRKAIFRYEKYWIPFLSSVSDSPEKDLDFAPPIDIHWVWHVHMLAPVAYAHDCIQVSLADCMRIYF